MFVINFSIIFFLVSISNSRIHTLEFTSIFLEIFGIDTDASFECSDSTYFSPMLKEFLFFYAADGGGHPIPYGSL